MAANNRSLLLSPTTASLLQVCALALLMLSNIELVLPVALLGSPAIIGLFVSVLLQMRDRRTVQRGWHVINASVVILIFSTGVAAFSWLREPISTYQFLGAALVLVVSLENLAKLYPAK